MERMVSVTLHELFEGCGRVSVVLVDDAAAAGGAPAGGAAAPPLRVVCSQGGQGAHAPVGGLCAIAIATGEPLNVADAHADARFVASASDARAGLRPAQV